jgi:hypothetical protein
MKRTYKEQAKLAKMEWAKAVVEGRVLRFNDGMSFRAYPTKEERDAAVKTLREAGIDAAPVEQR